MRPLFWTLNENTDLVYEISISGADDIVSAVNLSVSVAAVCYV